MVLQFPLPFAKRDNMDAHHPVEEDHRVPHNMGLLPKPRMHKVTTLEEDPKAGAHRAEETISVEVREAEEEEVNTLGWVKEHHWNQVIR